VDFRWVLDISAPKPPVALVESRVLGINVAEEDTITRRRAEHACLNEA
jgi:hypothetical protein